MPGGTSTPIVSEAEIQAALAEAQAQETSIPSLDDGQSAAVVPVPVETAAPLRPMPRERPSAPRPAAPVAPAEAPAKEAAAGESPEGQTGWSRLWTRVVDVVYGLVDGALWAINSPFAKVSAETRQLMGLLALVTMVVALAAAYLLPRLCPPRDAISQLTRQSATFQQTIESTDASAPR